jgi:PST family polysaccharide transporter
LYATQIAAYLFPLAVIPYLSRVLGPFHWGLVAFAQAVGLYVALVIDFGFTLSATRRVARFRADKERLERILAGVLGAKLLLSIVCVGSVIVLHFTIPTFRAHPAMLWAGAASGIGQGFSMLWFYQGMERMRVSATMDVIGKGLSALGVFVFVHRPEDAWRVLALQCICYLGVAGVLLVMAYREVSFRLPSFPLTVEALRESAAMFMFKSAVSLYTTANALILGALATPLAVGFYSGAERITRALINLLSPVSQSLYPRLNRLIAQDHDKAIWLTRISMFVMGVVATVLGTLVFVLAPLIIRIVLGPHYEAAVPVLRVLSLLLPAIALSNVLGVQWMLSLGMDRVFNKIIISAGLLNVVLALCWAPRWQELGMAWAVVTSEMVVSVSMCLVLVVQRLNPFSGSGGLKIRLKESVKTLEI